MTIIDNTAAPEQPTRRRRKAVVAALASATLVAGAVGVGLVGTGAWFSDTASSEANVVNAGILRIGDLETNQVVVDDAQPMTDEQAVAPGNPFGSAIKELTIVNDGTLAFDWEATLSNAQIAQSAYAAEEYGPAVLDPDQLRVAYQGPNGAWTFGPISQLGDAPIKGENLARDSEEIAKVYVYFAPETPNTYQGAAITFDVDVDAVQTNKE